MDPSPEKESLRARTRRIIKSPAFSLSLAIAGIALAWLIGVMLNVIRFQGEIRTKMVMTVAVVCFLIWSIGLLSGLIEFRNTSPKGHVTARVLTLSGLTLNF